MAWVVARVRVRVRRREEEGGGVGGRDVCTDMTEGY